MMYLEKVYEGLETEVIRDIFDLLLKFRRKRD